MADNIPELVQCPYCGEEAYSDAESCSIFGKRTGHNYAIACTNCEASSPGAATMEQAIEAWNTRAAPKVKPLVWDDNYAQTMLGSYTYGVIGRCWAIYLNGMKIKDSEEVTFCEALKAAKAAAQADYESRILSALQ